MTKQKKQLIYIIQSVLILIIIFFTYKKETNIPNIPNYFPKSPERVKKEFNEFLEKHGEEINLEKMDTSDWKTYEDYERGFSFQYPPDWHVIPMDSTEDKEKLFSYTTQNMIKKEYNQMGILSNTSNFSFSCLVSDKEKYEWFLKINSINDSKEQFFPRGTCKIVFYDNVPSLKSERRTSTELWLDYIKSPIQIKYDESYHIKVTKYFISDYGIYITDVEVIKALI